MFHLRALIWKAYKVRLRSPLSTALDVGGPLIIMLLYVGLKLIPGLAGSTGSSSASSGLFRNPTSKQLNPSTDLQRYFCNKVLFYAATSSTINSQNIANSCGIELISVSSKEELTNRLKLSLQERIAFKSNEKRNLNKSNSTASCISLTGSNTTTNYQAGIVLTSSTSYELHLTDLANNPIIHQPYSQVSSYNEYRFPHGDLNSGLYLLEICLNQALRGSIGSSGNTTTTTTNSTSSPPIGTTTTSGVKWHLRAFPEIASPVSLTNLFIVFQLAANFCNALATVMRVSEDNESGLHHYIRASGVPASVYWLSQWIVIAIHMAIQSLVIAIMVAIPIGDNLMDPFAETTITMRWLLLLTYSIALGSHALFLGSMFQRYAHAVLATCLLGVAYSMHIMTFLLQWNPYKFTPLVLMANLILLNPASNFEAMLMVLFALFVQTNQPLNWNQLGDGIIGGGMNNWTLGELWLLMILQGFGWFFVTVFIDQLKYTSSWSPIGLFSTCSSDIFCCCCCCLPRNSHDELLKSTQSKSKTLKSGLKSAMSKKDPNRICCSIRNVSVMGPSINVAQTKGDPLKMTNEQLKRFQLEQQQRQHSSSRTDQYLVNRGLKRPQSASQYRANGTIAQSIQEPIVLDETLQQHIVWQKSKISYDNLNLDFRFNQVSFILGQTSLKELLFASLLGLRSLQSGYIVLDGNKYTSATLNQARPQIGYLGERDIFVNEMTVYENLQLFGSLRDTSYTEYDSESLFVLSLLHLSKRRDNTPSMLTTRSARKLALALAAVGHTKLLLLVEPTMNLRWRPRCQVLNLLKKYKSIRSIVVDTSDVDEATAFGDRVILVKDGQTELDGTPERLSKRLACGHWIIFEPITGGSSQSIKTLENVTSEIFKQDKLENLDTTQRSIYEELMKSGSSKVSSNHKEQPKAGSKTDSKLSHKTSIILKVKHSQVSNEKLCQLLRMFSHNQQHGFHLAELAYESLEDILVLKMSKAIYPNLPPDLLLSLQHRTQVNLADQDSAQVSVRRCSDETQQPKVLKPIFIANFCAVIKSRLSRAEDLLYLICALITSLIIFFIALWTLQSSLVASGQLVVTRSSSIIFERNSYFANSVEASIVDQYYKHRVGLYILTNDNNNNNSTTNQYLNNWKGNKNLVGIVPSNLNQTEGEFVSSIIRDNKDLPASLIFYDSSTGSVTILFEPHLPHAMLAGIRRFMYYHWSYNQDNLRSNNNLKLDQTSFEIAQQFNRSSSLPDDSFKQDWHEMIQGYLTRRVYYGIGLALAEGIAIGALVIAPVRHRAESRVVQVRTTYWFAMALFDLTLSMILVSGYIVALIIIEGIYSLSTLAPTLLILLLYKIASLPIAYLTSLVVESRINGFLFIILIYTTFAWLFSIHVKTFLEMATLNYSYLYTVGSWIVLFVPISSLIDSMTDISHLAKMDKLCSSVPAYTATSNLVDIDGPISISIADKLLEKVRECLANGKNGISKDVLHTQKFGIVWDIILILLFAIIAWMFLLFSERVFGILARRFSSVRNSSDPLKTIVRSNEPTTSIFKWDRERDRLVSDYIRCMNEVKYVRQMVANCLFLRIWLKPMSDQSFIDKRILTMIEPIINMGQPKNDIQVELKTTLQLFIRIGNETNRHKMDRIQLIEAYTKFMKDHSDTVVKFAVVNWTKESLYKILLHGYYNTKSSVPVT